MFYQITQEHKCLTALKRFFRVNFGYVEVLLAQIISTSVRQQGALDFVVTCVSDPDHHCVSRKPTGNVTNKI